MSEKFSLLEVRPVITYPREALVGRTYLMTIDLQPEENFEWQYEEEEYPIYLSVGTHLFSHKPIGEAVVILHRFGGSYGVAKFLLETTQQDTIDGEIEILLINRWGVPINLLRLFEIQIRKDLYQENSTRDELVSYLVSTKKQNQNSVERKHAELIKPLEQPHQIFSGAGTELERFWDQVLEILRLRLGHPSFETWIKPTNIEQFDGQSLVICTPNPFIRNWIQKYYLKTITEVIEGILGHSTAVRLTIPPGSDDIFASAETSWSSPGEVIFPETNANQRQKTTNLNPNYVFSRFVVGKSNRMAHAASVAVAEAPGKEFNPLLICGGDGLGKTHLIQAIIHYILAIAPNTNVKYVSIEQFTNDLIAAIKKDNLQNFRDQYRAVDVLLVDDIQFIEGKEYTEEEFFHTFNALHEEGKQVVLASDRPPNQISKLQERLISRFSMGLIADIQTPDLETRIAILQKKVEYDKLNIPQTIIEYIAACCPSNIRELEGALNRVVTHISISGLPISVENIKPIISPPAKETKVTSEGQTKITPEAVIQAVAETMDVSLDDMKSNSRRREISLAQTIGMYLMRKHTDLSLPKIGEVFGGKDHTTVMYACDRIAKRIETDVELADTLRQLSSQISVANQDEIQ